MIILKENKKPTVFNEDQLTINNLIKYYNKVPLTLAKYYPFGYGKGGAYVEFHNAMFLIDGNSMTIDQKDAYLMLKISSISTISTPTETQIVIALKERSSLYLYLK